MEPTEHELTVATDEAARHMFARVSDGALQPSDFDQADPMLRLRYREAVAPVVHDALRALPDRAESAAAVASAVVRSELEPPIDRVRALHTQDTSLLEEGRWCPADGQEVPCSTIRALDRL